MLHFGRGYAAVLAAAVSSALGAAAAGALEGDVAERMVGVAATFNGRLAPDDADVRASLYAAAAELAGGEARLLRLRLESAAQVGDVDSALAAVGQLRKKEPQNTSLQTRQIELNLSKIETADAKLKYLGDIVATESLSNEVRSLAATRAAWLYWEQSRSRPALEMVRRALQLNAINSEAQRLQWVAGSQTATPLQRAQLLLSMLRASPGDIEAAAFLAEELAGAGLHKLAAEWFDYSLGLSRQAGMAMPRGLALDYACVLYLSGRNAEAGEWLQRVLKMDSGDPASLFLLMASMTEAQSPVVAAVQEALQERLKVVQTAYERSSVGSGPAGSAPAEGTRVGRDAPATGPATSVGGAAATEGLAGKGAVGAVPEPVIAASRPVTQEAAGAATTQAAASGQVAETGNAVAWNPGQAKQAYVTALADLAWFHLYFKKDVAATEPLVDQIRKLVPPESSLLARLDGWVFLTAGKLPEARVKLSAGAERDPLCELGLVEVMRREGAHREAAAVAKSLLEKYRSGVIAVLVHRRLEELKVRPETTPAAEALRDLVDRFPSHLRRLATSPQEFYSVRAAAAQVEHEFSQPILITVTIRNTSDQPLTMGERGILRDVWLDVQLRGGVDRFLPAAAYAPLSGPLVLAPKASHTQVLRVDTGVLGTLLDVLPSTPVQMTITAVVNAVGTEGGIAPGIYGYRSRADQMVVRSALPLWNEVQLQSAMAVMEGQDTARRLRLADAAAAHLMLTPENAPQPITPALQEAWRLLLDKGTRDVMPLVQTWALYRKAVATGGAGGSLEQLASSPSVAARTLAAVGARTAPEGRRTATLARLREDADGGVRQIASAIAAMPQPAPTTAPTTEPLPLRIIDIGEPNPGTSLRP
jgi:tetratricopeptide (TPR) repeat protein